MTFTITAGWWLVPLAATIVSWFICWMTTRDKDNDLLGVNGLFTLITYLVFCVVPSLIAWLIWALTR
jgi:hypothetical protein